LVFWQFLPTPVSLEALAQGFPLDPQYENWNKKTRVPGLACGENCMILRSYVLSIWQTTCDRQTDRHAICCEVAHWHSSARQKWIKLSFVTGLSEQTRLSLRDPVSKFATWQHPAMGCTARFAVLLPLVTTVRPYITVH